MFRILSTYALYRNCKLVQAGRDGLCCFSHIQSCKLFSEAYGSRVMDKWDETDGDLKFYAADVIVDPTSDLPSDDDEFPGDSLMRRLEADKREAVLPILHKWIAEGKESCEEIMAALNRLKWLARYRHAFEISDWVMHQRPLELQRFHYLNHLQLIARLSGIKAAEKFYKKMPSQYRNSEMGHVALFECYIAQGCLYMAKHQVKNMKDSGFLTKAHVFNKLFTACRQKHQQDNILLLLKEMRGLQISPDIETYNILIDIKGEKGDKEGMERLIDKMKSDGEVTPNAETMCILADGYLKAGDVGKVEECLQKAVYGKDFRETRRVHERVMRMYGRLGNGVELLRVWKFSRKFPTVSLEAYTTAIEAFAAVDSIENAEMVFREMLRKKQSAVRVKHYNCMVKVYCDIGDMRKAERVVGEMMNVMNVKANGMTYHHMVSGYCKGGCEEMALLTMERLMKDEKIVKPCYETMLKVLDVYAERGDVMNAETMLQNIKREGYSKNVQVYHTLLKAYLKCGKHAYRFLQRMASDKLRPNNATFELLNQMKPVPRLSEDSSQERIFLQ